MTIIPIHYIDLENKANECEQKINQIANDNLINKKTISNFVKEFNKIYSKAFSESFPGRPLDLNLK